MSPSPTIFRSHNVPDPQWDANEDPNNPDPSWVQGLRARGLNGPNFLNEPGANFYAQIVKGPSEVHFLQNLTDVVNGRNGMAAGWVYSPSSGYANRNMRLPTLPLLDGPPGNYPFYGETPQADLQDPNITWLASADSPQTFYPVFGAGDAANIHTQSIDLEYRFTLYVVASYNDESIYAVASDDWKVNFFAREDSEGGAPTIQIPRGVSAKPFMRGNTDPGATSGVLANAAFLLPGYGWV